MHQPPSVVGVRWRLSIYRDQGLLGSLVPVDHVPLQFVSGHGVTSSCTCDWSRLTWGQDCYCVCRARRAPADTECVYSLSTSARLSWCFADGVNDVPKVLQDIGTRVRTVFPLSVSLCPGRKRLSPCSHLIFKTRLRWSYGSCRHSVI